MQYLNTAIKAQMQRSNEEESAAALRRINRGTIFRCHRGRNVLSGVLRAFQTLVSRLPVIVLLMTLVACGRESDLALIDPSEPKIVFATDLEIERGQVSPHSYLVAFKHKALNSSRSGLYFRSRRQQSRFHQTWLKDLTESLPSQRYLASLDLSNPSRSFQWRPQIKSPTMQFLQWNQDEVPIQEAHLTQIDFTSEEEARITLQLWLEDELIWYAEPNYISHPLGELEDRLIGEFDDQDRFPWLNQIEFIQAMEFLNNNNPKFRPVIAVMDSGIDMQHPSLKDRVFLNEFGENKLCRGDLYGCNTTVGEKDLLGDGNSFPAGTSGFGESCGPSSLGCWHGTHVAGIIAADAPAQVTGVCPYCRVLNVKVTKYRKEGEQESFPIDDSAIVAGLAYISGFTTNGEPFIRVVNASLGKFGKSRSVEIFIRSLKEFGKGIVVVAAAGNEDTMKRNYVAAYDDAIAVSNIVSDSVTPIKSPSSNFGMWVDIAAPGDGACYGNGILNQGQGILSTIPGGQHGCLRGTSMASPVVAGVAGLVLANEPELTYNQLRDRLISSSQPGNLYRDGVNDAYRPKIEGGRFVPLLGSGIVNAYLAVNPQAIQTRGVSTEKSNVINPGCAVIGSKVVSPRANVFGWFLVVLSPVLILLLRMTWESIMKRESN